MCERGAVNCHLCRELNASETALIDMVLTMRRLQKTLSPIMKRYEEIHRAHPRCALCTIMVGPEHLETKLVPEPMVPRAKGQKRYSVCPTCYDTLKSVKRSVPQQIKYSRHVEEELVRLDEDDKIEYDGFWRKFRDENIVDTDAILGLSGESIDAGAEDRDEE